MRVFILGKLSEFIGLGFFFFLVFLLTLKCIISNTLKMCVCKIRFVTAR